LLDDGVVVTGDGHRAVAEVERMLADLAAHAVAERRSVLRDAAEEREELLVAAADHFLNHDASALFAEPGISVSQLAAVRDSHGLAALRDALHRRKPPAVRDDRLDDVWEVVEAANQLVRLVVGLREVGFGCRDAELASLVVLALLAHYEPRNGRRARADGISRPQQLAPEAEELGTVVARRDQHTRRSIILRDVEQECDELLR